MASGSLSRGTENHVAKDALSLEAFAGTVAVACGVVLVAAGTIVATRGCRAIWRILAVVSSILLAAIVAFVVGPAVAATNVPRPGIGATPASSGLA